MKTTNAFLTLSLLASTVLAGPSDLQDKTELLQLTKPSLVTSKPGRPAAAELRVKTSKVPAFEIYQKKVVKGKVEVYRVKNIPRLDIGEEPVFQSTQLDSLALPKVRQPANTEVSRRQSPESVNLSRLQSLKIEPVPEAKQLIALEAKVKAPAVASLPAFSLPQLAEPKTELVKIDELSAGRLKLLQALIFLEVQKSYNMAIALFAELVSDGEFKSEATYQLALAAKALGLYSEYKFQMMKVLADESKEWKTKAAISLAQSAEQGDKNLVPLLDQKIADLKIETLENADQYQLNRAKYYLDKENLTLAHAAVDEVSETASLGLDAKFLKSVILYKGGHLQEAITSQSQVLSSLLQKNNNPELKSIAALTLARMYFQASQYKEAFETYLKVDKTNPEWTQAMIEQAWSQILAEDYEGAAGNMFTLHTDFFKNSFVPESYVIRTVGYLNLCQYGDGAKVINDMKHRFTPVQKQLEDYATGIKSDENYYDTVKAFVKNPDQKLVDGLPRNFVFELARHPSFINEQKMINSSEEQISRYNRITLDLIQKERDILQAQNDVRVQVNALRKQLDKAGDKTSEIQAALAYQDKRLMSYKIQHFIAKKARTSIKDLRAQGIARLELEKAEFKSRASLAVKNRFEAMRTTLKNTLDQSEVLNYELFAGAGEHIRYQMAGGDITDKDRQELKAADGKSLKWEFRGEVWEDELGHYRSSLKNVCPRESISQLDK